MPESAAAPAPPSTPATAPAPALGRAGSQPSQQNTPRISAPAKDTSDAFAQLDALAAEETGTPDLEAPASAGGKAPVKAKDDPEPTAKPGDKAKPDEIELKPGEFPTEDQAVKMRAGQLSRHYKELKKAFSELQQKQQNLNIQDHPEYKKLSDSFKSVEEKAKAAEDELKFSNFERSSEYKDQYWKPYADAFTAARNKISQLKVISRVDAESGEVVQESRQATPDDFDRIVATPNDEEAAELAEKLFGNTKASLAMINREKVLELNAAKESAKERFRKDGGEREKTRSEQAQRQQAEVAKIFQTERDTAIEKYPQWFKPVEGDAKGNQYLEQGMALADSAFTGQRLNAEGRAEKIPAQELAKIHSAVRNKAAAFDRLVFNNNQAKAKIKALEAKLAGFQGSEPGPGNGKGKGEPQLTLSQSIDDQLMKRADRR